MAQLGLKKQVPELDYVARSFVWLSILTWSEAMHRVSAHHLPQYYQSQEYLPLLWLRDICAVNMHVKK